MNSTTFLDNWKEIKGTLDDFDKCVVLWGSNECVITYKKHSMIKNLLWRLNEKIGEIFTKTIFQN